MSGQSGPNPEYNIESMEDNGLGLLGRRELNGAMNISGIYSGVQARMAEKI